MFDYNDTYQAPIEIIDGERFYRVQTEQGILKARRLELGLTQQQVADKTGILLRQYARLESGERCLSSASFRIGLAICDALELDPHRFAG